MRHLTREIMSMYARPRLLGARARMAWRVLADRLIIYLVRSVMAVEYPHVRTPAGMRPSAHWCYRRTASLSSTTLPIVVTFGRIGVDRPVGKNE